MSDRPQSGPLLQAARLYKNVSAKTGSTWFGGRWGALKVVILENKSHNPDDPAQNHHYNLFLQEAPPSQPRPHPNGTAVLPFAQRPAPPQAPAEVPPWQDVPAARAPYQSRQARPDGRKRAAGSGKSHQMIDDVIPFSPEVR